jgi:flagellar biosynthesis/type III secretory pathway protein FliH
MTDSKQLLEDIVKNMTVRDIPIANPSVTREELEQRAKMDAEEEAKQEAQKAYNEAYADAYDDAYQRILDELLDEHGISD